MSAFLCSEGDEQRKMRASAAVSDDDNSMSSSFLNNTPSACTSNNNNGCQLLFQEIPEDVPDRRPLDEAEKLIAKDLTQLSHKEREEALHDIHGVSDIMQETPDFVAKSMNDLEFYLMKHQNKSSAFQMVWIEAQSYVKSLYLKFLRCDEFNIPKAGARVYLHFGTKLWLFGKDKLGRDITLGDFDKDDKDCYRAGFFQILPVRDRAGRAICIKLWKLQKFRCRENVWRQMWYNHMIALEDEETQRKGLVQIIYNVNDRWRETFDKELYMGVGKIRAATPIRVTSVHYCFNDPAFGVIIKLVSLALEMHTRTRVRLHYGSDVEVQYELQGFGIPLRALPVTSEGTFRLKEHTNWIKARQTQEKCKSGSVVIIPTHADVLFGRGKILQSHVGNLRLSNMIEEELERYYAGKGAIKVKIGEEIVERLAEAGGRFLRQGKEGVWDQVDERTAVDKVRHGFRNRKPETPSKNSSSVPASRQLIDKRAISPSDESPSQVLYEPTVSTVSNPHVGHKRSKFDDQDERNEEKGVTELTASTQYVAPQLSQFHDQEEETEEKGVNFIPRSPSSIVEGNTGKLMDLQVVKGLPDKLDEIPFDLDALGDISEHPLDDLATEIW